LGEPETNRAVVLVCITCRTTAEAAEGMKPGSWPSDRAGEALADAVVRAAASFPEVSVRRVRCLANCSRGPSAAVRCAASWTYVFGHLAPEADGPALIEGARLLAQSTDGTMPWKGRPEPLKRGLIARVPPADYVEEPS
jgi:predicted metal-binding protein